MAALLLCALLAAGLPACDKKKPTPKPPTPTTQAASATSTS
ncbi:hypothetical protein [Piscinibacter terrae]|nr:hypothetical protein [Albitalea terrae]